MFETVITEPGNRDIVLGSDVKYAPQWWRKIAKGGDDKAEVTAAGPQAQLTHALGYLGHDIAIQSETGNVLWSGRVWTVRLEMPAMTVGWTLKGMANKVRVTYLATANDGTTERKQTGWAQNDDSIEQYGTTELNVSVGEKTGEEAVALRDQKLIELGNPQRVPFRGGGSDVRLLIEAQGHIHDLDRVYYANANGIVEFDGTGSTWHPLGYAFTSNQIKFEDDSEIKDYSGDHLVAGLTDGVRFIVGGSASNNGIRTPSSTPRAGNKYAASTIRFEATDDMIDTADGFGDFADDSTIRIAGSVNDGIWRIDEFISNRHINLNPNEAVSANAGPPITIISPDVLTVDEALVDEEPGADVTITAHSTKIAQKFTLTTPESWPPAEIQIKLQRFGNPIDNVRVAIHDLNINSGAPGSELFAAEIVGNTINDERRSYHTFELSNAPSLQVSSTYFVVVTRTGANSGTDYYTVDVVDTPEDAPGEMMVWTGSAWETRVNAAMPFRVLGAVDTAQLVASIADDSGQEIVGSEIGELSGIFGNQFRDGDRKASKEIDDLVASGYKTGEKMILDVTGANRLHIYKSAAKDHTPNYQYTTQGELHNRMGGNLEPGVLVVDEYAEIPDLDLPPTSGISPLYIESCEYSAKSGRYSIDLVKLGQGGIVQG